MAYNMVYAALQLGQSSQLTMKDEMSKNCCKTYKVKSYFGKIHSVLKCVQLHSHCQEIFDTSTTHNDSYKSHLCNHPDHHELLDHPYHKKDK